jgi:hypothetical protein
MLSFQPKESTRMRTGHVIYNPAYTYKIHLKTTQVKGLAFTGYSATPKTGIVTKMNGPRHIISIDNQPAGSTNVEL